AAKQSPVGIPIVRQVVATVEGDCLLVVIDGRGCLLSLVLDPRVGDVRFKGVGVDPEGGRPCLPTRRLALDSQALQESLHPGNLPMENWRARAPYLEPTE